MFDNGLGIPLVDDNYVGLTVFPPSSSLVGS